MAREDKTDIAKKTIKNILTLAFWVSLVFIMLISITALKINSDESCGIARYNPDETDSYIESTIILTDTQTAALQDIPLDTFHLRYKLCVGVNSSQPNKLSFVDSNNNTLANVFVDDTSLIYCSSIDKTNLQETNYLGVRCDTCSTKNITILKYTTGTDVSQIITNFATEVNTTIDEPFYYKVLADKSCKSNLKFFTNLYLSLLVVFMICILILMGYTGFKKILFEDW